ncbi:MAG: type II secretion system F family protein [Planctomycetota bacterium]|nr:type II secretion system F family protein [Planctomycetota bacterium]MDA1250708.1 type II secretion system F family protein [Planctomycetota bacterium]
MTEAIIGSTLISLAFGVLPYAAESYYLSGLERLEVNMKDKLRQLRVSPKNLRSWLVAWSTLLLLSFLTMTVVFGSLPFGLVTAGLLAALPWHILKVMAEKRHQQIEDQLADAMVSLSSAIKAGLSLAQALDILAQQTPRPICQEFQQIVGEYQLGKPLERCLKEAKVRLRSENFALFAAAMEASRESGGRLNETVERIAHSVRELQRLERKVLSETAQARTSALYMALAPGVVLAMYYFFLDPVNTARLFTTFAGQVMLCAAVLLNVSAFLWARKILNPEI